MSDAKTKKTYDQLLTSWANGQPSRLGEAWQEKTFAGCVNKLITISNCENWQQFAQKIKMLVDSARHDEVMKLKLPEFEPAIVERWATTGIFYDTDRKYLSYVERVIASSFGKASLLERDHEEFYDKFQRTSFVDKPKSASMPLSCKKGFIADTLASLLEVLEMPPYRLALKSGIYPSFIEAYLEGDIVPEGAALKALKKAINPSGHRKVDYVFDSRAQLDNERLQTLYAENPNRLSVVKALGSITKEKHLHEFMDAIINKNQWDKTGLHNADLVAANPELSGDSLRLLRFRSNDTKDSAKRSNFSRNEKSRSNIAQYAKGVALAVGDESGLYERLISDFALQKHARRPFAEVFDDYINRGNDSFRGLFDAMAKEWEYTLKEACATVGLNSNGMMQKTITEYAPPLLQKIAKQNGFTDQQTKDLVALRLGTLGVGTVETLTHNAQAILNEENATYEMFENTPIVRQMKAAMPSQAGLKEGDPLDKTLVPNALLGCLLNRVGASPTACLLKVGKTAAYASSIITGEEPFVVTRSEGRLPNHQTVSAEIAGRYFTQDKKLAEELGLAFLEIGKKQTPDELMEQLRDGKLAIGDVVRICRLQHFLGRRELAREVTKNPANKGDWVLALESDNSPASAEVVTGMADLFYKRYPKATTKADFIAAARGKPLAAERNEAKTGLVAKLEEQIEEAFNDFGKAGAPTFASILPLICDLCGDGVIVNLQKKLESHCGKVSRTFYFHQSKGGAVQKIAQANAFAEVLVEHGVNPDLKSKIVAIARQRVARYDAASEPDEHNRMASHMPAAEKAESAISLDNFEPRTGGHAAGMRTGKNGWNR